MFLSAVGIINCLCRPLNIEYIITIYNTMYMNLEVENVKNELILHNKFKNQYSNLSSLTFKH